MFKIGNQSGFLREIEKIDESLVNIKLHKIEIDRENLTIKYHFISDKTVSETVKNKILDFVESETPEVFSCVELSVQKIATDPELIANSVYAFIKNNYPSVSMWLEKSDVTVNEVGVKVKYTVLLAPDAKEYFESNNVAKKINDHLYASYCSSFVGEFKTKELGEKFVLDTHSVYIDALSNLKIRTLTVSDVVVIDDPEATTVASYMQDATEVGNVVLAGTITSIKEKETKNGKPFFIIDFTDTTAKMCGVYFTKKNTLDKIRDLTVGQDIIVKGKLSFYGEKGLSLTIDKLNKCKFPENFVPEEMPLKNPPLYYSLVKPSPTQTIKVSGLFDEEISLPDEILNKTYVSVDLETTGLNPLSDVITEIGAVKIKNGKIIEQWTTLVDPQRKLTQENIDLTGITDEMLEGQPLIKDVFGDFVLFCKDANDIIGHNIEGFDSKFLIATAKNLGYNFNKNYVDTLFLAQELLPNLRKHKLNFIAEYFGIEFRHHRALSDAQATAEAFLELMKLKNKSKN